MNPTGFLRLEVSVLKYMEASPSNKNEPCLEWNFQKFDKCIYYYEFFKSQITFFLEVPIHDIEIYLLKGFNIYLNI